MAPAVREEGLSFFNCCGVKYSVTICPVLGCLITMSTS